MNAMVRRIAETSVGFTPLKPREKPQGELMRAGSGVSADRLGGILERPVRRLGEPGYEGEPLRIVELKDPDGEGKRELKVPRRVDILDDLLHRKRIEQHHFDAGRAFQADNEAIELWDAKGKEFGSGEHGTAYGPADATLIMLKRAAKAKDRLNQVFASMGAEAEIFLVAVLLNRTPLKEACRFVGWHDHSGTPALRLILHQLAHYYGLVAIGAAKRYTDR